MRCPSCGFENPEATKFCGECGGSLTNQCPSCEVDNPLPFKFCGVCGTSLRAGQQPAPAKSRTRKGTPRPKKAPRRAAPITTAQSYPPVPEAERRQLTVMFCDLVGSTALSTQLDPEDFRDVVRRYQQICAETIKHHDGYIAQYLGDGLLIYFGYPTAHEDDAGRAVRTGLEIIEALQSPVYQLRRGIALPTGRGSDALQVRIGLHTGPVVIGDIGTNGRSEQLALDETPNVAARIQGLAEPNTVIISAATQRLVEGRFECQPFGSHLVKGISTPIAVYHVQSERQNVSPLAEKATLTPLVGREHEVSLLLDRWEQAKEGRGQVILLSGEPGIGKSRLAYTLKENVTREESLLFESRCSPYHQHSALYPLIDSIQRTLLLTRQDTEEEKIAKLERALALYEMQDTLPLFTALLSLPTPVQYRALTLTPQKQKERTLQALVQLLVAQAERQATVSVWEDLHWADPSSLEFLSLLIEQLPTTKLLLVLTFRPEFTPPWKPRSHLSHLVLNRLGKKQVEAMIEKVATGKALAEDIIEQIRVKTDGVPLFVEELTKSVIESGASRTSPEPGASPRLTPLQLTIPATLQEALLARLDRLSTARQVAQLGATLGREFSHELIHALAPLSETDLHTALERLVEAEILYRRGMGKQARYFFKHALIQDTAYQSLLKSTRQHYHRQIAHILEERFPDTKETQPELLAHHYTEAGLSEHAVPYWQQAGQKASARSANPEAVGHLTKGLELVQFLPDTPARLQQELDLQITLGPALLATKSWAAPEVGRVYARARELCQRMGETPQLAPVLFGLWAFYMVRAEHQTACALGEQLLALAQSTQEPELLLEAHAALGNGLSWIGEFRRALEHAEQGIALYDLHQHGSHAVRYGQDPGVTCLTFAARMLWLLGYPDQALEKSKAALTLARTLSHPFSLAWAVWFAASLHHLRREELRTQELSETAISLGMEHKAPFFVGIGKILRGWAVAEQGQTAEGILELRQGLAVHQATGAAGALPWHLASLVYALEKAGEAEAGFRVLTEAFELVDRTEECFYKAELYRLKGELLLAQAGYRSQTMGHKKKTEEAEECFWKAIDIARRQQAKSLELRAVMSLSQLWQGQDKKDEARQMLAEIYGWFTEGFDTKDLQEAKALLEGVSRTLD